MTNNIISNLDENDLHNINEVILSNNVISFKEINSIENIIQNNTLYSIPKNLIFIWIGDNIPKYVFNSLKAHKIVNKEFNIYLFRYTIKDIEKTNDSFLKGVKEYIFQVMDGIQNEYYDYIKRYLDEKRTFCQILANILRFIILKKIGGIYLDCDTWPVKPFDDNILKRKSFSAHVIAYKNYDKYKKDLNSGVSCSFEDKKYFDLNYIDNSKSYIKNEYDDIFMIGQCPNYNNTVYFNKYVKILNLKEKSIEYIRNTENLEEFKKLQTQFFDCTINIGQYFDKNHYIEHLCDRTWLADKNNMIRSPKCKYDYQEVLELPQYFDNWKQCYSDYGYLMFDTNMNFTRVFNRFYPEYANNTRRFIRKKDIDADKIQVKIHQAIQTIFDGMEV